VVQLSDIAREANVSVSTVSLALRNQPQVSLATRERVQAVAKALGYEPNLFLSAHQANIRKGTHQPYRGTIAWVDDSDSNVQPIPGNPQLLHGAQEQAAAHGFTLDVTHVPYVHQSDDEANKLRLERIITARGIVGAIFPQLVRPHLLTFEWTSIAIAVYGGNAGFVKRYNRSRLGYLRYSNVGSDFYDDTHLALSHLHALGYRRIALITSNYHQILSSYRFTAARHAFSNEFEDVPSIKPWVAGFLTPEPPPGFRSWLRSARPDAVLTTLGCSRAWLSACALEAPRDIGLAHPFLGPEEEGWSGVRENFSLIGRTLMDAVVAQILRGERGMTTYPKSLQMIGRWEEGSTTRRSQELPT
jgi:DNA-binding LacI/PurR family transcriptional regulator